MLNVGKIVNVNRSTHNILLEKGINLLEFKEAFRIRNGKVENSSVITPSGPVRTVGTKKNVKTPLIPDAFSDVHNHTQKIIAKMGFKSFSSEDLKINLNVKKWKTSMVSTYDKLFTYRKSNVEIISEQTKLRNEQIVDNYFRKLDEKARYLEMKKSEELCQAMGKTRAEIREMSENKLKQFTRLLKKDSEFMAKGKAIKTDYITSVNQAHDEIIKNIAEETKCTYNQYTWEELMPNVFRSRGKKS